MTAAGDERGHGPHGRGMPAGGGQDPTTEVFAAQRRTQPPTPADPTADSAAHGCGDPGGPAGGASHAASGDTPAPHRQAHRDVGRALGPHGQPRTRLDCPAGADPAPPPPGALRPLARALLAAAAQVHARRQQATGLLDPYPAEPAQRGLPSRRHRASMDCPEQKGA